ncbi:hypothetical protein AOLI_G00129180 [Acnodon oligacanthus]
MDYSSDLEQYWVRGFCHDINSQASSSSTTWSTALISAANQISAVSFTVRIIPPSLRPPQPRAPPHRTLSKQELRRRNHLVV